MSRIYLCPSLLVPWISLYLLGSAHSSMAMVFQYDQHIGLSMNSFPQVRHAIHHSYFLIYLIHPKTKVTPDLKWIWCIRDADVITIPYPAMQVCPLVPAGSSCSPRPPLACSLPSPHTQGELHSWILGAQNVPWWRIRRSLYLNYSALPKAKILFGATVSKPSMIISTA